MKKWHYYNTRIKGQYFAIVLKNNCETITKKYKYLENLQKQLKRSVFDSIKIYNNSTQNTSNLSEVKPLIVFTYRA